jgi:hypothetical protein
MKEIGNMRENGKKEERERTKGGRERGEGRRVGRKKRVNG